LPLVRMAVRIAEGLELLEVCHLPDVDLRRQVSANGLFECLAGLEVTAGQRPRPHEWIFRAFPEEDLEGPRPHLEDGCEGHVRWALARLVGWARGFQL